MYFYYYFKKSYSSRSKAKQSGEATEYFSNSCLSLTWDYESLLVLIRISDKVSVGPANFQLWPTIIRNPLLSLSLPYGGSIESNHRHLQSHLLLLSLAQTLTSFSPQTPLVHPYPPSWLPKRFSTTSPPPQTPNTNSQNWTTTVWSPQPHHQRLVGPNLRWPTLANQLPLNPKTATPKSMDVAGGSGCPL